MRGLGVAGAVKLTENECAYVQKCGEELDADVTPFTGSPKAHSDDFSEGCR